MFQEKLEKSPDHPIEAVEDTSKVKRQELQVLTEKDNAQVVEEKKRKKRQEEALQEAQKKQKDFLSYLKSLGIEEEQVSFYLWKHEEETEATSDTLPTTSSFSTEKEEKFSSEGLTLWKHQEDEAFVAASTIKVAYALAIADKIEKGLLNWDQAVLLSWKDYEPGDGTITASLASTYNLAYKEAEEKWAAYQNSLSSFSTKTESVDTNQGKEEGDKHFSFSLTGSEEETASDVIETNGSAQASQQGEKSQQQGNMEKAGLSQQEIKTGPEDFLLLPKLEQTFNLRDIVYQCLASSDNTALHAMEHFVSIDEAYRESILPFPENAKENNFITAKIGFLLMRRLMQATGTSYDFLRQALNEASYSYGFQNYYPEALTKYGYYNGNCGLLANYKNWYLSFYLRGGSHELMKASVDKLKELQIFE